VRRSVRETLEKAAEYHRAGRLDRAEGLYRKVIAIQPNEADALHLLGLIAHQRGHHELAEQRVRRAIAARGQPVAEFSDTLGDVLVALGRLDEALPYYEEALALRPDLSLTHKNFGSALCALGRATEAVPHFEAALRLSPGDPTAHSNMGTVFLNRRMPAEAMKYFRKALELDAGCAEAWCNLGRAEGELGRNEEAARCLQKALVLDPRLGAAYESLGCIRHRQDRLAEAVACYEKVLALQEKNVQVYSNLGNIFKEQMRLAEAVACYDRAAELQPGFCEALWNRALVRFMAGEIERGWAEYEWGWTAQKRTPQRQFPQPWWDGGALAGRRLLFWGEQGVGDEMIFAGMIPELAAMAAHCIVECEPRLVPLFARSFPAVETIPRSNPPHPATRTADLQIPAGSAARWLRPSLHRFPRSFHWGEGCLRADPRRVTHWRERLAGLGPGPRIGICWRSSLTSGLRARECTSLSQWGSVLATPGVHFVNLQYDDCREELAEARGRFGTAIHTWPDIDLKQDLDEVAALTTALDLVVSVGTAVACMAGALGVPVWQLTLTAAGDCWTMGRDYCPWFPSMRLYERAWDQTWEEVLEGLARDLKGPAIREVARSAMELSRAQ
jgi:tetratricopeptide (TPR) repeat protein